MKKIFLPLLAVVGMALGLTLSSCGGGGSDATANEPARALTGTSLTVVNPTPNFSLAFEESNTGWVIRSSFTPGASRAYKCFFSVDPARPPKLVEGMWEIWGSIGFVDDSINDDRQYRALIGLNTGAASVFTNRFVLYLQIPAGKQSGLYAGSGVMYVDASYWGTNNDTDPEESVVETSISFEMSGMLKEEFLLPFAKDEETDDPFDY